MGESKNEEVTNFNDFGDAAGRVRGVRHLRLVSPRTVLPTMPAGDDVLQPLPNCQHLRSLRRCAGGNARTGDLYARALNVECKK